MFFFVLPGPHRARSEQRHRPEHPDHAVRSRQLPDTHLISHRLLVIAISPMYSIYRAFGWLPE